MNLPSQIPPHYTHDIHDSSKITEFLDCKRKYFWHYMMGLTRDGGGNGSVHLVHGEGMHRMLASLWEYKWKHGSYPRLYDEEGLPTPERDEIFDKYLSYYRETFGPEQDEENEPKTPAGASAIIDAYVERYQMEDKRYKVVETEFEGSSIPAIEVAGRTYVSFSEEKKLHYRLDLVVEDAQGLWIMDHKTTSQFSRQWFQQWPLSFQMFLYCHAGLGLFGSERFRGFIINGVRIFKYKKDNKTKGIKAGDYEATFERVRQRVSMDLLSAWHLEVQRHLEDIERETEILSKDSAEGQAMASFPKNPQTCTKYFGCPYHDLCTSSGNPLTLIHNLGGKPPLGWKQEWWDPSDKDHSKIFIGDK